MVSITTEEIEIDSVKAVEDQELETNKTLAITTEETVTDSVKTVEDQELETNKTLSITTEETVTDSVKAVEDQEHEGNKMVSMTTEEIEIDSVKTVGAQEPKTEFVETEGRKVIEEPAVSTINPSTPAEFYYTGQVGAFLKKLSSNYYDKFQLNQPLDELFIDNMYKYSVGKFKTLKEAKKYKNYVKQKGLQCFITAYYNGKRITIKEALAISKQ